MRGRLAISDMVLRHAALHERQFAFHERHVALYLLRRCHALLNYCHVHLNPTQAIVTDLPVQNNLITLIHWCCAFTLMMPGGCVYNLVIPGDVYTPSDYIVLIIILT